MRAGQLLFEAETPDIISVNARNSICGRGTKKYITKTPEYKAYVSKTSWALLREKEKYKQGIFPLSTGTFGAVITLYMGSRLNMGVYVPRGDIDNPIKPLLDSLQLARIVDDDARFIWTFVRKIYRKSNPGTKVQVYRSEGSNCDELEGVIQSFLHGSDP